jgi:hypothetical protein
MHADVVALLIPILGIVFGVGGPVLLGALFFPSIRAAVARRIEGRSAHDEAAVIALQLQVEALEAEVSRLTRALPSHPAAGSPPADAAGRARSV